MTIHQELAKASPTRDTVITIGTFDGVHLGHRQLLGRLQSMAVSGGFLSTVLTFRNHPRLVLNPGAKLQYITPLEERVSLLKGEGAELVVAVDFTSELSLLAASEFVELLSRDLRMKGLVVGPDFALGHGREGNIPFLKRLGSEAGFWVEPVEPVQIGQDFVRSSSIRGQIAEGDVESASRMLGRWFSIQGLVVEGDRRGKQLGFPTVNLSLEPNLVVPADGIYATWAIEEGRRHQAATCVGVRPTFGPGQRVVEAFLLDFEGDLYGRQVVLKFVRRLREELAFPTAEALVEQMKLDVEDTQAVLTASPEFSAS